MKHLIFLTRLLVPAAMFMPMVVYGCGGTESDPDNTGGGSGSSTTASTAGLDKYTEDNIYSRNVELPKRVPMQGFSIDNDGSIWYTLLYDTELYISKGAPNRNRAIAPAKDGTMRLTYFGHGTNTSVERDGDDHYVWAGCYGACNSGGAYWTERLIGRVKYVPGAVKSTDQCDEYYYIGNYYNVQPTVDVEHDQLAVQYDGGPAGTVNFVVYKLSEAKKAPLKTVDVKCTDGFLTNNKKSTNPIVTKVTVRDLTALKPVAAPKCPWRNNPNLTYYPWQGYDVNGDRLFFVEGGEGVPSHAYLTVYDMSGRVVESRTRIKAVSDKEFSAGAGLSVTGRFESEGVKVKDDKIYFGFSHRHITAGDNNYYQTILQFSRPAK